MSGRGVGSGLGVMVSTKVMVDTKVEAASGGAAARRRWTVEQKRRIVEETQTRKGASVSVVARRYDINANLLFKWKREAEADQLGGPGVGNGRVRADRRG